MKKTIAILLALCFALSLLPAAAYADEPEPLFETDENGNYLITSEADWNFLADQVKAGEDYDNVNFKLTNDITVSKSVGEQLTSNTNSRMRFAGNFDGGGNTLTIELNTANAQYAANKNYCAPFAYTKGTTIRDLTVEGTIYTGGKYAAGLIGSLDADSGDVSNILNVHVAVTFRSTVSGDATDGGIVGILESDDELNIKGSWFDGSFLGERTTNCGGFVGYNKGTVNYQNVLFNPAEITFNIAHPNDLSDTFARLENNAHRINNFISDCYYTKKLGSPSEEAKRVYAQKFDEDNNRFVEVVAADGETYYIHQYNMQWKDVQDIMENPNYSACFVANDILAGEENTAIVCDREFELNLNECVLDRALADETGTETGYVILVKAGGELTLRNGTITGGHASENGGGVYVAAGGTLHLEDVTITGNKANGKGGGVYVEAGATLTVKGVVNITYNSHLNSNHTEKNLYLAGSVIDMTQGLSYNSVIGVGKNGTVGVFTSGLYGNCSESVFTSDNTGCTVRVNDETGEAELRSLYNVSVSSASNGTVTANVKKAAAGDTVTLTVTPADGYVLGSLEVVSGGNAVTVTGDRFTMPAGNVTVNAEFAEVSASVDVYDGAVVGEYNGKKAVTFVGTVKDLSAEDADSYSRIEVSIVFYKDGEQINSKSAVVKSIYTTISDTASVSAATAVAQDLVYVEDADYIFALRVAGSIPAGDYSAFVTVSLISAAGEPVSTASKTVDYTVD